MKSKSDYLIIGLVAVLITAIVIFGAAFMINMNKPEITEVPDVEIREDGTVYAGGETLEEMALSVVNYCITDDMTEVQKYRALHDYIVDNAYYDFNALYEAETKTFTKQGQEAHDARLVLAYGRGVCDGYAYAYQALCKAAGLPCEMVFGDTDGQAYNNMGHAWNRVKVGGHWYHVDVTWDDPVYEDGTEVGGVIDYFLVSDKKLKAEGRDFELGFCTDTQYD